MSTITLTFPDDDNDPTDQQREHEGSDTPGTHVPLLYIVPGDGDETKVVATPRHCASLADPGLGIAAEIVDDLERTRIANENRLRQLTRMTIDSDGLLRGRCYSPIDKDIERITALVEGLKRTEHEAVLHLQRVVRVHPLGIWGKQIRGVGDKQLARLLAVIGDPYIREIAQTEMVDGERVVVGVTAEPRTVSALWAYTGYRVDEGQACRRKKGVQSNWSTVAKTRAFLIVEACLKAGGNPYRDAYDTRKAKTEGRTHAQDCVRCGPSGKPALTGSEWSAGHRHADAMRVAAKTLLRDLWRESKRLHEDGLPN